MKRKQRFRQILALLQTDPELSVDEACARLNSSPATIRRDFIMLVQQGQVEKTWGGIKLGGNVTSPLAPLAFTTRLEQNSAAKRAIAQAAAGLLQDGDVVMIDGGTTTYQLTEFIARKRIRIITNSLVIAQAVDRMKAGKLGAEIYLVGGLLHPESGIVVGPPAEAFLQRYRAKWAFLSAAGVDGEFATNYNEAVLESEKLMIEHSKQVVLLADHTKIGRQAMCTLCSVDKLDYLFTVPCAANDKILRQIQRAGVKIVKIPAS